MKRRLKAYHYTGVNIEEVLMSGVMLPGGWVFRPEDVKKSCLKEVEGLKRAYPTLSKIGMEAIRDIIGDLVGTLKEFQDERGLRPAQAHEVGISCADQLAGEYDMIFFSPNDWSLTDVQEGLVLDARELFRGGAKLRMEDMNSYFHAVIRKTAQYLKWNSVEEAKSALVNDLLEYSTPELEGQAAVDYLESLHPKDVDSEIIWEGPLDLERATILEVWSQGKRLPREVWGPWLGAARTMPPFENP